MIWTLLQLSSENKYIFDISVFSMITILQGGELPTFHPVVNVLWARSH